MNYTQLKQAIQDYAENTEDLFVANIPTFVEQAESRVYNTVHIPTLRKNVTGSFTLGNRYLSCPTDFLAVYSIAVIDALGSYTYLLNKDVSFVREAYPSPATLGIPRYYSIFGPQSDAPTELSLLVTPTPDNSYSIELHYFYYPISIVVNGTSWLGDNYDPVLFYGAMREALTFMKAETDTISEYETKYQEAILQLSRLVVGLERGDSYRDGQNKLPGKSL